MSAIAKLALVPALVLALVTPDGGRLVVIETTATLAERTEGSVALVIEQVRRASARHALALGLPWARLHSAVVSGDVMIVQVIAADRDPAAEPSGTLAGVHRATA